MKKAAKFKRTAAGTIEKPSRRGRLPGVPPTEKELARKHRAALRKYDPDLAAQEEAGRKLDRRIPGSRSLLDGYQAAISEGNMTGVEEETARGLTDLALVRRDLAGHVKKQGSIIREVVLGSNGEPVAERLKVHPGVEPLVRISETLGFTSTARRLDPKSRGEGQRDEAIAKSLERDKMLRSMPATDKARMAPPAEDEPIDAEVAPAPALPAPPEE